MFKSKWSFCAHFSSKNVHFFFKWCKTAKSLWLIFGFDHICQIFENLFAKKHEGGFREVWNFVSWPISDEKKCSFSLRPPSWGQISPKYLFWLYRQKIFAVSFKSYIQLVLKISFISFQQPAWIETDSIVNSSSAVRCVQLVPNIHQKWNWTEDNLQIFCLK